MTLTSLWQEKCKKFQQVKYHPIWWELTTDDTILQEVSSIKIEQSRVPYEQSNISHQPKLKRAEYKVISPDVSKLASMQTRSHSSHKSNELNSPIFLQEVLTVWFVIWKKSTKTLCRRKSRLKIFNLPSGYSRLHLLLSASYQLIIACPLP